MIRVLGLGWDRVPVSKNDSKIGTICDVRWQEKIFLRGNGGMKVSGENRGSFPLKNFFSTGCLRTRRGWSAERPGLSDHLVTAPARRVVLSRFSHHML